MRFTLTQAAKESGVSKGTISKALKSGRLSGERQEDGSFQIEPVELFRVFPRKPVEPQATTAEKPMETVAESTETLGNPVELAMLRLRVEMLQAALDREREVGRDTIDDLRRRLDAEQEERRNLQRQLVAPQGREKPQEGPSSSLAVMEPSRSQRGFLGRLWGR